MRLDKFLANMGCGSRKEIKTLAKKKQIFVNKQVVKKTDIHIDPEQDQVELAGQVISYKPFIYVMLHKPAGYISATEDPMHETVLDLLMEQDKVLEPFPVGRLDKDTEGLLLLTNDGLLAHDLLSPKKHIEKTYIAHVAKPITTQDIKAFQQGVILDDGYLTKPASLRELDDKVVEVIVTEGKFHQVKRMFEAVNNNVLYLKREVMGTLRLDPNLRLGEYRELKKDEILQLKGK
ncbi:pseudouridine synthase [Gracilibacillus alcaliphilus]|uniref:pseudouridine synthase n=1 Tax=Gracilibacillus alcaliphilus TaxID=1401441 RepID=UPI001957DB45|nr:pseudouridine synthase [Gracilibacillus alcaliphilus]MBM7679480.1 16S rRNA pseudouridine516 synthase [Gracilibacillus alcaliphilus]